MRRISVSVSAFAAVLLFAGAQPAVAATTTKTVESVRPISNQSVSGICGFGVTVDQRDNRTVKTWTNRNKVVGASTVRTKTSANFTSQANGLVLDNMAENYVVATKHHRRGEDTVVFAGEGALWGTASGVPFFLWMTGVVAMRGSYDYKTGFFTVSSKTVIGLSTDLCESLATGLKPRH